MKSQEFLKYFNVAAEFASKDNTRPILQAVFVDGTRNKIESADGFHAISFTIAADEIFYGKSLLVQPNRRTSKGHLVQRKPNRKDYSDIQLTANNLIAGEESFLLDTGIFPDLSMACPRKQAKKFTISLNDLTGIVQSGRDSVEIDKDGTCYPPAVFTFEGIQVGYNPVMLKKGIEFMRLFDVAEVDLYLQVQSSCAICPAGGKLMQYDTPTYIFMPMHLDK